MAATQNHNHVGRLHLQESVLRQVFSEFDRDGDGAISTEELTKQLQLSKLSRSGIDLDINEVELAMKEADRDNDGQITYEESLVVRHPGRNILAPTLLKR